uniref:Small ribosomal subunit protein uS4 n=1 Tax=Candidatus Methanomethylicus mesodigestus TaxID=1867258 RepID=A0A7C3FCU5_9CREN
MGDPKKSRRKWQGPRHPWKQDNLKKELSILGKYGLRNKRELWIANSILKSYRKQASEILGLDEASRMEKEKSLIKKLVSLGLLQEDAVLDNILGLSVDDVLERRLQTMILKMKLANTPYQARQLITHGHIMIGGRRISSPGYIVRKDEEPKITCNLQLPATQLAEERGA